MIRALMVYPDTESRGQILNSLAQESGLTVVAECHDGEEALEQIENLRPDAVFAGIGVPRLATLAALTMSGFAKRPYLVVIANSGDYAVEAFDLNAIDYLLTPIDRKRLTQTVQRLRRNIEADQRMDKRIDLDVLVESLRDYSAKALVDRQDARVSINFGGRYRFLNLKSIRYIEADASYVDIHMTTGEVLHSTNRISEVWQKLPAESFLRIHRSTIVNIEHIREARAHKDNYEIVMDNDVTFRPGTTYKSRVRAALVKGNGVNGRRTVLVEPRN